jgi:hypothetical protein
MIENLWDGKGDLPTVGTVCEVTHDGHAGKWRKIEILKYEHEIEDDQEECRIAVKHLGGDFQKFKIGSLYWLYNFRDHDCIFRVAAPNNPVL